MPNAHDFLKGFGFRRGTNFGGYTLTRAASTHDTISRYQEYHYDITLEFTNTGTGNYNSLATAVVQAISQTHVIYGIRNPYQCSIEPLQQGDATEKNGIITFKLTGHSHRI